MYDSPDLGHDIIVCGDKREGWVCIPMYGLGDKRGLSLVKCDWF